MKGYCKDIPSILQRVSYVSAEGYACIPVRQSVPALRIKVAPRVNINALVLKFYSYFAVKSKDGCFLFVSL